MLWAHPTDAQVAFEGRVLVRSHCSVRTKACDPDNRCAPQRQLMLRLVGSQMLAPMQEGSRNLKDAACWNEHPPFCRSATTQTQSAAPGTTSTVARRVRGNPMCVKSSVKRCGADKVFRVLRGKREWQAVCNAISDVSLSQEDEEDRAS